VADGTFTSITNNQTIAPSVPHGMRLQQIWQEYAAYYPDFRRIPVGDIDLLREIRLENTGITDYGREGPRVRRVYTAKIEDRKSNVTVAIYQGEGAQEVWYIIILAGFSHYPSQEWREDMERYSRLRYGKSMLRTHNFTFVGIRIWFSYAVSQIRQRCMLRCSMTVRRRIL
jgi:hypothetical protein